jgi:predicted nuclease of predicted toxin-antitoxin system
LPLRIVADENLDARIIAVRRRKGISVLSIREAAPGMDDRRILAHARELDALLVTEDGDFGELVFSHKQPTVGVIFLRYGHQEVFQMAEVLAGVLLSQETRLKGRFSALTSRKLRMRDI